jgi:hypothetical protein
MWVFFNRDYEANKRQDIVFIEDEDYVNNFLVVEKIVQIINDPHEAYENVQKKKELSAKIQATKQ